MAAKESQRCSWIGLHDALRNFVTTAESTQSQLHIKPLHWHLACRLVIEGGFLPDDITPRPPFQVEVRGSGSARHFLHYDPDLGGKGEQVVLGGLKTKQVDVVVSKAGIGPCVALSAKGTRNAFRNFTNRMEEAVGDCTNLHLAYPALVYGFIVILSANRHGPVPRAAQSFLTGDSQGNVKKPDMALDSAGEPVPMITRFHDAVSGLANRSGARNSITKYESVALVLVSPNEGLEGTALDTYPLADSPLRYEDFFGRILRAYDERFVYFAPDLQSITRRIAWDPESPALHAEQMADFNPRRSS